MTLQRILKWLRKILDYLILNKDLIRAYLNNYKNETIFTLADKIAKGFVKQEGTALLTDYITSYINKRTKGVRAFFGSMFRKAVNVVCCP